MLDKLEVEVMEYPEHLSDIEIYVSAEHIQAGTSNNCTRCPVALAVREAFQEMFPHRHIIPHVNLARASATVRDERTFAYLGDYEAMLPPVVIDWIKDFDEGPHSSTTDQPFSFTLDFESY